MWTPPDMLTKDGYDLQWGTNVVVSRLRISAWKVTDNSSISQGHWLLTDLLVPALEQGALSSNDKHSRVVHTSASAVYLNPNIFFDTFVPGPARNKKTKYDLYSQSKAGNCVIAREGARRYGDKRIVVTAVNPGNIRTELTRYTTPMELWLIASPLVHILMVGPHRTFQRKIQFPAAYGALPQLYAATAPETLEKNGKVRSYIE
jgi:retinol dehydrogenase-12